MKTQHAFFISNRRANRRRFSALATLGLAVCGAFAAEPTSFPAKSPIAVSTEVLGGTANRPTSKPATMPGITASAGIEHKDVADTDVIARINDVDVKVADLRSALQLLDPIKVYEIRQNPVLFQHLVESVALHQLLLKQALARHWDQEPKVASKIEQEKSTTITNSYLLELTKLPKDYPSDAELKKAYDDIKESLSVPHRFQLAQIFVALPATADKAAIAAAQTKLEGIVKRLQEQGTDFAELARSESDDKASAAKGGEMGWVEDKNIPGLIRVRVSHLAKNGIADPVRIDDGWHIVKMLDSTDVSPVPYEEVKETLTRQLREQKLADDMQAYLATLLKENPVNIDQEVFSGIMNPKY